MSDTYIIAGQMAIANLSVDDAQTINARARDNASYPNRPVAEIHIDHDAGGTITMALVVGSHYTTGWVEVDDFSGEINAIITDITACGGMIRRGSITRFGHTANDHLRYCVKTRDNTNAVDVVRERRVVLWKDTTATLPESWIIEAIMPQDTAHSAKMTPRIQD